jgi:hypothetical protein
MNIYGEEVAGKDVKCSKRRQVEKLIVCIPFSGRRLHGNLKYK